MSLTRVISKKPHFPFLKRAAQDTVDNIVPLAMIFLTALAEGLPQSSKLKYILPPSCRNPLAHLPWRLRQQVLSQNLKLKVKHWSCQVQFHTFVHLHYPVYPD